MIDKEELHPEAAAAWQQGLADMQAGRWTEADKAFAQVLALQPQAHVAWLQRARCAVAQGQQAQAGECLARFVQLQPQDFSGWLEYGNWLRRQSRPLDAARAYDRAASCQPQRFEAHLSLARVLEELNQWAGAAVAYHRAVLVCGANQLRSVHWRMANFRLERGDVPRALEAMRQALMVARLEGEALDANVRCEMQIDLGDMLMRLGMASEAHRAFERASASDKEATLARLAQVSFRHNLWQEAQQVCKRATQLYSTSDRAWWNLAYACAESWSLAEAEQALTCAESLAPQPGAASLRAALAGRRGDVDEALRAYTALADQDPTYASSAAMSSLYTDQWSASEVAALHRRLFAPLGTGARAADSFARQRRAGQPIRLGILSADMHHQHPVNLFMQPVLARLDRSRFETFMYYGGVAFDSETQKARQRVQHWVQVLGWSDAQLARRIEADGIDLVLDLSGHTTHNRMAMLAQRVAPVQISFLGYPHSTGVPNIDAMLADPVVAPPGSEALFTEHVLRLPNTVFCYAPEVDYPFPAYGVQHLKRPLTFGSFNNVPKLTPHTLQLWARVLEAVPGSRLLLKAPSLKDASAIAAFAERLTALGVDLNRVEFRGPTGLTDMMAEYEEVDIALDPVPYNGGTTTLQALWMGVPVVVKAGHNFVSRMGASFMTAASLPEWVAPTDDDYVAIAQRMAQDRAGLLELKRGLRDRLLARPGWDIAQYTRDFETTLEIATSLRSSR
jgi:predicted O-linked N-acetylglucosamine transferase (SPINDLY family)